VIPKEESKRIRLVPKRRKSSGVRRPESIAASEVEASINTPSFLSPS